MQSLSQQNNGRNIHGLDCVLNQTEHINGQAYNSLAEQRLGHSILLQVFAGINWQRIALILFLFSILAIHTTARAEQWLFSDPLVWDARFMFDGRWRNTEISPGNKRDSEELRYREEFSFKKRIHILDPGIATFSFDIRPMFSQTDYVNTDDISGGSDSATWNYTADSSFLHGSKVPVSLTAGLGKATGVTDGSLGSHTDFDSKNSKATLNLKSTYFPSHVSYTKREQELVQTSGFLATPVKTHDKTQRWNYRGSSENLNLNIEHLEYDDFIYDRRYTYDREHLNHNFEWGENSRLNSRVEHVQQKGFGAYKNAFVAENAHFQHTPQSFTAFRYNYNRMQRTFDRTSHQGNINYNHQLSPDLNTSIGYQKSVNIYSSGDHTETTGPQYSIGYNRELPFQNSSVAVGVSGTDLEQGSEWVDAIDRPYTVAGLGDITLSERYIDITSIVITSDTGALYFEGVGNDYTINQVGGVTVITIPASTTIPFAAPGDPLTVLHIDYIYHTPANESHSRSYYVRLNLDNFQLYYTLSENDQELLEPANELSRNNESSWGILYNLKRDQLYLGLGLEARRSRQDQYWSESLSFKQDLSYIFTPLTMLSVNANETSAETTLSDTSSVSVKAGLKMRVPESRITVNPYLSYWQRDDNIGNDDTFYSEGVDFSWRYYLITFSANFNNKHWSGTTRNNDEYRLMFTLTRRSR